MLEIYERDENGGFSLISERDFFSFVIESEVINEFKDVVYEFFMNESFDKKICFIRDFYNFDVCFDKVGLFILIKLIGYYEDDNVFCYPDGGY